MAKYKTKRYDAGGGVDDSLLSNTSDSEVDTGTTQPTPQKPKSFSDAFKDARAIGLDSFSWRGADYSTKLASDKKPTTVTKTTTSVSTPKERSMSQAVNAIPKDTGGGPSKQPYSWSTDTEGGRNLVNALNALGPVGRAGKIATQLALANRGARVASVAEKGREAVTNPLAWTGGPRAMKAMQETEDIANKAMAAARKRTSGQIPDSVTSGGAIGYKRGGSVKKMSSGGMSSTPKRTSASKRADGIAMKGFTRA